jgi:hypothetical protein
MAESGISVPLLHLLQHSSPVCGVTKGAGCRAWTAAGSTAWNFRGTVQTEHTQLSVPV